MTIHSTDTKLSDHETVWQLLPWYLNGTLNCEESSRVKTHLSVCILCRDEIARCREITKAVHNTREDDWESANNQLNRVMAQIDAFEAANETTRRFDWRAYLPHWLRTTPLGARWALAAQSALVIALAGVLLWPAAAPLAPTIYQTYTDAKAPLSANQPRLRLVLTADMTVKELQELLTDNNAAIVAGPSPLGVYTIVLAERSSSQKILEALRANPQVMLAEPVAMQE